VTILSQTLSADRNPTGEPNALAPRGVPPEPESLVHLVIQRDRGPVCERHRLKHFDRQTGPICQSPEDRQNRLPPAVRHEIATVQPEHRRLIDADRLLDLSYQAREPRDQSLLWLRRYMNREPEPAPLLRSIEF
jgi:hypothetical protein